jgi:hypothetical protein
MSNMMSTRLSVAVLAVLIFIGYESAPLYAPMTHAEMLSAIGVGAVAFWLVELADRLIRRNVG